MRILNLLRRESDDEPGTPSGIGMTQHSIEPHPSEAPYPYIIDDGIVP